MYQESLYKYIPFNAPLNDSDTIQNNRQSCFEKGEVWFPKPSKLNDPFECSPYFKNFEYDDQDIEEAVSSLSNGELKAIGSMTGIGHKKELLSLLKTPNAFDFTGFSKKTKLPNNFKYQSVFDFIHQIVFVEYLKTIFSTSISNIGVLSLTEDPFNLRMWAHYGGNSTGICMEFGRNSSNILGSKSTKHVEYVKKRPKIMFHDRKNRIKEIIYTKSHIWCYEKEWRTCQAEGDKAYPFPGKVRRILFGLNCQEDTVELTKNIFGKNVIYENITMGENYSIQSDHGIWHSISQVELNWH